MAMKKKPTARPSEVVTLAVRIPADLRRSLRLYCADKGAELQAVARAALEEYLKKRGGS